MTWTSSDRTKSMRIQDILDWYSGIDEERRDSDGNVVDIDRMLYMRKQLAVRGVQLADLIYRKQVKYKTLYEEKKLRFSEHYLTLEGTVDERKSSATKLIRDTSMAVARLDGEVIGLKVKLDSVNKILDSMSGYINTMRSL